MACTSYYYCTTSLPAANQTSLRSQIRPTSPFSFPALSTNSRRSSIRASSENMTTTIDKLGIKIERNPPESKLAELSVRTWPKWGCPPSKFPWTYSAKETCYVLEGKVKVTPEGATESVEIGPGDLVVFPKGMSCTWDVSVAIDKHYYFE